MNHFKNLTLILKKALKTIIFFLILFKKYSKHFLQLKRVCEKQAITSIKKRSLGVLA
ncbi:hypothetical protein HMPREF1425_01185 [Helicobacter pylori GAM71Ai]|nr:hypothetical protein HMPREF1405_00498 [Helicobacter pylori GAM231Ai]EMH04595.1 hypothetical protein HMPREF1406_00393 [Helicobacter pylori GAM239Bi]EMH34552.1 hypothetical protein HMPREF1425_01185 [Helicobacter pylori GAM71Ai]EMJ39350.1 hypothetical protein HMPREF1433_01409 [Helicobacter pylori GAMchJs117Ai]EMJ45163.1 hypothetical protein HMPREF1434_00080 [Helicobacter pylori GAMchJs124i]